MNFLNLTLPEALAVFSAVSAVVVALYLLDRLKKKHTVATLRFFVAIEKAPVYRQRRKLQQPWSLALQLVSLALLLLAIAQVQWGGAGRAARDHVLILDTSAWMSARVGAGRLMDEARSAAKAYLKSVPAADRVMLVRADALATPATRFETDRGEIERAIDRSTPGVAPLDVAQALETAQQARRLRARRPGEIVFIGAGRIAGDRPPEITEPASLRTVSLSGPAANCGIRKVAVRRSAQASDSLDILVTSKNYGPAPRSVPLVLRFGGAIIGTRRLDLAPGAEESATFRYSTRSAGWLEARLLTDDAFPMDDRAVLELPARATLPVNVYSDQADLLKPIFSAIPDVKAGFLATARYQATSGARIVVLDRFGPVSPPAIDSIWIEPPAALSPIPVRAAARKAKLARWSADHQLGLGLRGKDVELNSAEIFTTAPDDITVAETDAGPLVVGRAGAHKTIVLGFHPGLTPMKYELTTPVLFANILRWMAPDIFRSWELTTGTAGMVTAELESDADPAGIRVIGENRKPLPFTVTGRKLRFFAGAPGIVRVFTAGRELVYSLTLPQAGDIVWKPATGVRGLSRQLASDSRPRDLWPWLAFFGGLGLLGDWLLFGRGRRGSPVSASAPGRPLWRKAS
jgi:hypothetical protein